MDIITFENDLLKMNSGILEENFGKMSYSSIITEEGVLVKGEKKNDVYTLDYSPWTFSGVQSFDVDGKRTVFFMGSSPFSNASNNVQTLNSLLDNKSDKNTAFKAGYAVMQIMTDAALNDKNLPYPGAGGTLLELNENSFTVLFLPLNLFDGAVAGKSDAEKARNINWWKNPTLSGYQNLRFARSVIAYKVLTGRLPFPATDTIERNADILDKKFLPLEMCIENADPKLCEKINAELELNSATVYIPGKEKKKKGNKKKNPVDKIKDSNETDAQKAARLQKEYQKGVCSFPFELFVENAEKTKPFSDEELNAKTADYMAKKTARIAAKRKIRRNTGIIIGILIGILVAAVFIINSISTKGSNLTSKGLTAEQTVEAFYQEFNRLNTAFVYDHGKGKAAKNYSDICSQMYVIGKSRTAYSQDRGVLKPAAYFLTLRKETDINKAGLYGISNLSVNGKTKNMDVKIPTLKEKPEAITEDKGITVYDKMQSVQKVHFFLVHTEDSLLMVEECTDTVTLTFKKDKWIVTDISSEPAFVKVDSVKFFDTFFDVMELIGQDPQATVRIMKTDYPWLPTQKEIEVEIAEQIAAEKDMRRIFGQE